MAKKTIGPNEAKRQAEDRSHTLILEFHAHIDEIVALHPEYAEKAQEIFEAWAIQKIAGLQLSVEHLAEQMTLHLGAHKG